MRGRIDNQLRKAVVLTHLVLTCDTPRESVLPIISNSSLKRSGPKEAATWDQTGTRLNQPAFHSLFQIQRFTVMYRESQIRSLLVRHQKTLPETEEVYQSRISGRSLQYRVSIVWYSSNKNAYTKISCLLVFTETLRTCARFQRTQSF